jgi:hypothetical protein
MTGRPDQPIATTWASGQHTARQCLPDQTTCTAPSLVGEPKASMRISSPGEPRSHGDHSKACGDPPTPYASPESYDRPPARVRLGDAYAAATTVISSGQRVSRRSLRSAGLHGSNADLSMLARRIRAQPWTPRPVDGSVIPEGAGPCQRVLQSSLRMFPAVAGVHGAGPRQKRRSGGVNQWAPAPPGRRGRQTGDLAPGRWPGKASCGPLRRACGRLPGRRGQAADLPVAQPVEDQGQEPGGGSDLGDVLGFLAAAADDGALD